MNSSKHQLARIICAGYHDIEEWRLGNAALAAAKGYPRAYPAEVIDDYGIVFLDLIVEAATGELCCHEVNGPNAVGSDALTGESFMRAQNEARQAARRARELGYLGADGRLLQQVVTVHAHQHWKFFRTGGEFYPRVDQFAEILEGMLPGNELCRHGAGDTLGGEAVAVVMGDVPAVAGNLTVDPPTRQFRYQGRPVIFMGNPNLLSELIRTGKVAPSGRKQADGLPEADLRVLHAWRLAPIIHDKARQQRLMRGTGIRPLRHFEAGTPEEALRAARKMLEQGAFVLKPNGTSGGTGVHVVTPGMTEEELAARVRAVVTDCVAKYGENAETMAFPLRGFEFVRSTGFPMEGGEHLWDLRFAVEFEPGKALVYPVSLRLAPQAFDPGNFQRSNGREQWVSNVSGRRGTLLKSGMDDAVMNAVGMTPAKVEQAMQACVNWTCKAWDSAVRNGGVNGMVYEDDCESEDALFYPWSKFHT